MLLLIFGATGSVGHQVVEQALEQGHSVAAFTRNPQKLNIQHPNLKFIEGDVMNSPAVEQAVQGKEAVLCSLGAGRNGVIRSEGTRNIVKAMEKASVQRLICQSTLGVGDSRANLDFFWKYIMFGLLLRPAYTDHVFQEAYVRQSRLDWTIVRPAAFTDEGRTGAYQHGFTGSEKGLTLKISRADVADFMLKQLGDNTYLHKTPGLSY
ncbi:3 beta-hydroxysteroid dehydrogenase/Delta 5--_4-isomerase [Acaryochloris thomasi RCC1774]|uniref:3 beta-hydroxysteroid dehydrogenase/Delta 5-->4-isomerase n=1 Tax=Acaryochloris thomasi RCC1774 TaxID=1764569 RepID=A0A2W1J883_9CYAN|nr:SDR family oxidoreductase [Acaryochloris thomasi]PZD70550.1 3 beta-hydroxysteroid dehydrogenase/Delta 5-->4-isomerase [Acaryochloris thomasi RCC1774]